MARIHLIDLNGRWYYNRRIPSEIAHLDKRVLVRQSTKIRVADDPRGNRAARIAMRMDDEQHRYWGDLLRGRTTAEAYRDLQEAMKAATRMGLLYLSREDVVRLPESELYQRINILTQPGSRDLPHADPNNVSDVRAVLGGDAKPKEFLKLSEMLAAYVKIPKVRKRNKLDEKGEEEMKRFLQVRRLAVERLIASVGDKDITQVTTADGRQFVDDCTDHIEENDGKGEETARHQFAFLTKMLREVGKYRELTRPDGEPIRFFPDVNPFDSADGKRMPFKVEFVRDKMLAKPSNLDATVHDLVLVCIDTGARPSEIIRTPEDDIHLDNKIPFVDIRAGNGRSIKNKFSQRKIPLVGCALEAMQRNPKGFSQFRENQYIRLQINNWLRSLQPDVPDEEKKTLYCLRHTFKDRLLRTKGTHQETIDYLMGHNPKKEDYGFKDVDFTLPVMSQLAF
jgi:integrase